MLYPTHHHSLPFHFTPSPSSLSAPHPLPLLLPPTSLSPQVVEMELGYGAPAVEKAGGDGGVESDFFVDDLLDFSNASLIEDPEEAEQKQEDLCVAAAPVAATVAVPVMPTKHEFESLPVSVPAEDMESLEWLSHFVDDSFSEYSLTCPLTKLPPPAAKSRPSEPEMVMVEVKPTDPTPVQTKARTKRARTGGRVWSLGSPSLSESPSSSTSSTSTTTSTCSPAALSMLLYPNYQPYMAESPKQPAKRKTRRKPDGTAADGGVFHPQARRCSHCGVQKTPQWRSGPLGSKTLCNACGVRYKSGRLLPEYRPACSPTYSEQLHSNNHRKVMEMRRKKDGGEAAVGPLVQSF